MPSQYLDLRLARMLPRRKFLTLAASALGLMLGAVALPSHAIWIQSSPIRLVVNAQGEGQGEIQAQNGLATFTIAGAAPGFELTQAGVFGATGEAYFLDNLASFEGVYQRIEQNIDLMSIDGVRGGIKLQNQHGIVIYLTGPSEAEQFDGQIQELLIALEQAPVQDPVRAN